MNSNDAVGEFISAIFGIILSGCFTFALTSYNARQKIRKIRKSYLEPYQVPTNDKRNIILLIGLGGTGKTALIKSLLDNEEAKPEERTKGFDIYYNTSTSGKIIDPEDPEKKYKRNNESTKYWFFIADYKGQNLGTLISAFIQQQKREYSPLAYGFINSLILVVDLYPPKNKKDDLDISPQSEVNKDRVSKNINEWNDTALDAIFGLITEEIEYVCLFINKIDLMSNRNTNSNESYIEAFDELKKRIDKRCKCGAEVLLGSAQFGTEVTTLRRRLMEKSVPGNHLQGIER